MQYVDGAQGLFLSVTMLVGFAKHPPVMKMKVVAIDNTNVLIIFVSD